MPNDAKLGLIVGVGLVIVVAVVFFRKEAGPVGAPGTLSPTPAAVPRDVYRPVKAAPAPSAPEGRRHVVEEGETLFHLAERFLGSKERFVELYLVNRDRVKSPDALEPGTELVIPNEPPEASKSEAP
jgi:nucleoid-associated protein YgaU